MKEIKEPTQGKVEEESMFAVGIDILPTLELGEDKLYLILAAKLLELGVHFITIKSNNPIKAINRINKTIY